MKRLKLKKQVWISLIVIIFGSIGIYAGIKVYQNIQYKKTNEYKLIQVGYSKEEANNLEKLFKQDYLNKLINEDKNEFLLALIKEKYFIQDNITRYLNTY